MSAGSHTAVIRILRRCYSHVEVADREGNRALGVTNLKRVFGRPAELRVLVDALVATIGEVDAVASADTGSAPLAAVVAYRVELPSLFVRETPKEHFLSYGGDPATNHPRLSGERLPPGSRVHIIDDLVNSGETLASAARLLREAYLDVRGASCLLTAPQLTGWPETIVAAGITRLDALAATTEL